MRHQKTQRLNTVLGSSHCGAAEMDLTSILKDADLIPGLTQWVKDPELLWLWCRPEAIALIEPLAWEPPYSASAALKRQKEKKKERRAAPE